ncbi:IclR family transcriptional regulator [Leucobacter weissii]|uniref:IclR family transcriptional regulator n=1 Tax=Leucobacter weissii TaxID=1983706 RepID=A0A939S902_9MICO|nr:IclR family transcriptional regulator [Leucobacter weissii]MBO1900417.1 IclR family transcriptional regulator [Leucobacter weissii]
MGSADGSSPQGILDRALGVLGCFTEDEPALTAAELSERTGLPASTMHRLIGALLRHGLMVRVPDHRYAVGPRLWELGELSPMSLRLRERAIPHLVRLYEATGENVHLAVLDGAEPERATVLYVGRITGRLSIPTISRAGGRGPLHATGVGRALLATRDEIWLERYLRVPRERETAHTITGEAELRAELERTRARGYASTREEMTLGNVSVAVALPQVDGLPPAAIGLVVHLNRADERRLSALVVQSAREIHAAIRQA